MRMRMCEARLPDECSLPPGVTLFSPAAHPAVQNDWLCWFPGAVSLTDGPVAVGLLTGVPLADCDFTQVEKHSMAEVFLMVSGTGTLLLPSDTGWQLLALPAGWSARIQPGVPHYFGPAIDHAALCAVACHPGAETCCKALNERS